MARRIGLARTQALIEELKRSLDLNGATLTDVIIDTVRNLTAGNITAEGSNATTLVSINNTATDGDPVVDFQLGGATKWAIGCEDGDSDKFVINNGSATLGSDPALEIDASNNTTLNGSTAVNTNGDGEVFAVSRGAGTQGLYLLQEVVSIPAAALTGTDKGRIAYTSNFLPDNAVVLNAAIQSTELASVANCHVALYSSNVNNDSAGAAITNAIELAGTGATNGTGDLEMGSGDTNGTTQGGGTKGMGNTKYLVIGNAGTGNSGTPSAGKVLVTVLFVAKNGVQS